MVRKEDIIQTDGQDKTAGALSLLGLLSALLAAINQLIRLRQWRGEETETEALSELAEDVEALEARLDAVDAELERLEAEKDCQD